MSRERTGLEVAVVGMACRLPGADGPPAFWRNLRQGVESVRRFSEEELVAAGVPRAVLESPSYVRARAIVGDVERFDARLFGYSPREAELIDPQHRLLLECAWHALEDAAHDPEQGRASVGVFAGCATSDYLLNIYSHWARGLRDGLQTLMGTEKDYLASRVSYKLGLQGPSVAVQTACSSSLVAVHLACQSLLAGECDAALAGGVTLQVPQVAGYFWQEGGIYSPTGRCRPFDAAADGTVFGEGAGLVVLKRLEDALAAGDRVRAVILGSAINNDGAAKVGYTAPSVTGQAAVIRAALEMAEVDSADISYIEAHGTATGLGDPIEVAALREAFGDGERGEPCAIGSVKGNFGHLANAAGVAGLIKTILALEHGELPPSLHYQSPNPAIDFAEASLRVVSELQPWPRSGPRRAGVSSFGLGGTNAHVVLEEAPTAPPRPASPPRLHLLPISAASEGSLERLRAELAESLLNEPRRDLGDVAYTLSAGRRRLRHRGVVLAATAAEAATALREGGGRRLRDRHEEDRTRPVVFLFPGHGSEHVGMGAALYATEPLFRQEVDRCCELSGGELGDDLRRLLVPQDRADREAAEARLEETRFIQPALFIVEYALANLWTSWGVAPEAMLGHSTGELVAAALAGVFSLEDALRLIAVRGRLMQDAPAGAMLMVPLPERAVAPRLTGRLVPAAVNEPAATIVSGPAAEVAALREVLLLEGVESRPLAIGYAFHGPDMAAAAAGFEDEVARVERRPPDVPFLSNVTGTWITAEEAVDPTYWGRQVLATVRFSAGVRELLKDPRRLFLEVGPGRALTSLVHRHREEGSPAPEALASLPHRGQGRSDRETVLDALGSLWAAGADIDWRGVHRGRDARPVELPVYPFDRQRYWIERLDLSELGVVSGALVEDSTRWFEVPVWKPSAAPVPAPVPTSGRCVVFDEGLGLGESLARELAARGWRVTRVVTGERFAVREEGLVALDAADAESADRLLDAVGGPPQALFHLWSLARTSDLAADPDDAAPVERALEEGLFLFLGLARALARVPVEGCRAVIATAGAQPLRPGEPTEVLGSLLAGPATVLPHEGALAAARLVDLDPTELAGLLAARPAAQAAAGLDRLAVRLLSELPARDAPGAVAWRGARRFERRLERLQLAGGAPPLRRGGTYLLTGGLGALGLTLASHLARTCGARLALLSRRRLPPRERWEERRRQAPGTPESEILARLLEIESAGGEVLPLCGDVTDREALDSALREAGERFGPLCGVFHLAGTVDPKLSALKTPAEAAAVLAPKLGGTLNLYRALAGRALDFVVLYSSVIAHTGELGQLDYCAANAFLDAFAHRWQAEAGETRVVAVSWPMWREQGLAAEARGGSAATAERPEAAAPLTHPLLQRRVLSGGDGVLFDGHLDPAVLWVLDEHRAGPTAILPGTAYVEMAGAAWLEVGGALPVEMTDVVFGAPLACSEGTTRDVQLLLSPADDGGRRWFEVRSRSGALSAWSRHATGALGPAPVGEGPPRVAAPRGEATEVAALLARASGGVVRWGERWQAEGRLWVDEEDVWGDVALPARFASDLDAYALHPALFDVAAASILALAPAGAHIPLSYGRIRVHAALPRRVAVHGRRRDGAGGGAVFVADFRITTPAGEPLVTVEGYTLRRVELLEAAPASFGAPGPAAPGASLPPQLAALEHRADDLGAGSREQRHALTNAEALQALERVLAEPVGPQVAITKLDLDDVWRVVSEQRPGVEVGRGATDGAPHERPDLPTVFEAPRNELERACAAIWERILGVRPVGIHDDFFQLGGHSLIALQLVAELRKAFEVELGIGIVFDHPTVSAQVELVTRETTAGVGAEELDAALAQLAGLSDEEVAVLIARESTGDEGTGP